MNIFTRKKKLLAEIADLNEQIRIQSNEMDKLRKANTDLNRLWRDAVKENKRLEQEVIDTLEAKRLQGCIDATALGEKNKTIEELKGKKVGAAFRKEYNIIEGREISYTAFAWFCDADDVRSGKARQPKEKYRNGATGKPSSGATPILNEGFVSVPDDAPEEGIPF